MLCFPLHTAQWQINSTLHYICCMCCLLQVLKETLRLYPPGGGTRKEAVKGLKLSGYEVPEGTCVMVSYRIATVDVYSAHVPLLIMYIIHPGFR